MKRPLESMKQYIHSRGCPHKGEAVESHLKLSCLKLRDTNHKQDIEPYRCVSAYGNGI